VRVKRVKVSAVKNKYYTRIKNTAGVGYFRSFSSTWRMQNICDEYFTCCVEVHSHKSQWFPLHMKLTLRAGR